MHIEISKYNFFLKIGTRNFTRTKIDWYQFIAPIQKRKQIGFWMSFLYVWSTVLYAFRADVLPSKIRVTEIWQNTFISALVDFTKSTPPKLIFPVIFTLWSKFCSILSVTRKCSVKKSHPSSNPAREQGSLPCEKSVLWSILRETKMNHPNFWYLFRANYMQQKTFCLDRY